MKGKMLVFYGLIVLGFFGLGRTIDNSVRLIEHVFKPIKFLGGTLYYGQFFNLLVIFIGIKGLLKLRNTQKKLVFKSIVLMIIATVLFINTWNYGVKAYMNTKNDLRSIYNYHDDTDIGLDFSTGVLNVNLSLENCSDTTQSFNIQVIISDQWKNYISTKEPIILPKKYEIPPRQKIKIEEDILIEVTPKYNNIDDYMYSEEIAYKLYDSNKGSRIIKHIY